MIKNYPLQLLSKSMTLSGSGTGTFNQFGTFSWEGQPVMVSDGSVAYPFPTPTDLAMSQNFPVVGGRFIHVWSLVDLAAFGFTGIAAKNIATTAVGANLGNFLLNNYLSLPSDCSGISFPMDGGTGYQVQTSTGGLSEKREAIFFLLVDGRAENTASQTLWYFDGSNLVKRANAISAIMTGVAACLNDYTRFALHSWYIPYAPFTNFGSYTSDDLNAVESDILATFTAAVGGTYHGIGVDVGSITSQWQAIVDAFYPT